MYSQVHSAKKYFIIFLKIFLILVMFNIMGVDKWVWNNAIQPLQDSMKTSSDFDAKGLWNKLNTDVEITELNYR